MFIIWLSESLIKASVGIRLTGHDCLSVSNKHGRNDTDEIEVKLHWNSHFMSFDISVLLYMSVW